MTHQDNAFGNTVILVRRDLAYQKVGGTISKTLQGKMFFLDWKTMLPPMLKKLKRKNVIFIGPLTEPTLRRILGPSLFARKKVLYCTVEGPPLLYWTKPILKILSKKMFTVVAPSKFVRRELEMAGIRVSAVIPHALDLGEIGKLSSSAQKIETPWTDMISEAKDLGKTILLSVTSMSWFRKGLYYYLEALRKLERFEDAFLAVLKFQETPWNISSQLPTHVLKIVGEVSEMELYKLYSLSDVVVVPSLSEGFGIPIIEAFSAGKPVITLDAPPMNEINTEETGYLVKVKREFVAKKIEGDWTTTVRYRVPDLEDFVEKLRESIENVNERKSKALRASLEAKSYDCNEVYRKFNCLLV